MDRIVIERKLDSLRRCLDRVRERCPASAAALLADVDAQDILSLNLTRAVQLCVDLAAHMLVSAGRTTPDTMGGSFDALAQASIIPQELALNLRRAVGFRNLAVHNYDEIDWAIVFSIATRHLGDFETFARHVVKECL